MKREYLYFGVIIILVILIFIALSNNNDTETTSSNMENSATNNITNNKTIPNGQVGIVSHKYNGYGSIEVIIKNNTEKEINELKVTAECWDKNGNNLGKSSNGEYNINTRDTYLIKIYCGFDVQKYNLTLDYK